MKLTNEELLSALTGVVYAEQTDDGLQLHRYTATQEQKLLDRCANGFTENHPVFPNLFYNNTKANAGITLDFHTNAKEVCVGIAKAVLPYKHSCVENFDLYVNGRYQCSAPADRDFVWTNNGKCKRFTLYFPPHQGVILSGVTLTDGASFTPAGTGVDVLCLGDSITQGSASAYASKTWVMTMQRKLDARVLNQGNAGFVYDADVLEKVCDPKIIITAYGVNVTVKRKNSLKGTRTNTLKK